jgi:DNA invertase Pin-like site-specific DNA recombinase
VTNLDRLARSTLDRLGIIDRLGQQGASFKSVDDHGPKPRGRTARLMLTAWRHR